MSEPEVDSAMSQGKLYLGHGMAARQGAPRRHSYMQAAVKLLTDEGIVSPLMLEIGSWAGGSAVTLGKAMNRYGNGGTLVCIDAWRPYFDLTVNFEEVYRKMDTAARDGTIFGLFKHNIRAAGLASQVIPLRGLSADVLPQFPESWFDLAFVDGSHNYEDVLSDIRGCARVLKEDAILCGDDLELQLDECPVEYTREMAKAKRDYAAHPRTGTSYHPGVTLAVAELLGRVPCWEGFWAVRKRSGGWVSCELPAADAGWPDHFG